MSIGEGGATISSIVPSTNSAINNRSILSGHPRSGVTIMPCPSPSSEPTIVLAGGGKAAANGGMPASPGSPLITIMHSDAPQPSTKVVSGNASSSSTAALFKNATFLSASDHHVITVAVSDSDPGGGLDSPGGGPATTTILGGVPASVAQTFDQEYPIYSGDSAMYTTAGLYSTAAQPQFTQEVSSGSALSGGTYIIHGTPSTTQPSDHDSHSMPSSRANPQTAEEGGVAFIVGGPDADAQANNIVQATRVSPATVQWLTENYETAEGVSLPRSTLYNYYLRHTADHKLDPVNAASFGKLIRSVFMGLRTRRLGTRGNSKYHYYGIRLKPTSPLYSLCDDGGQASPSSSASTSPAAKKHGSHQSCGGGGVNGGKGGPAAYKDGDGQHPQPAEASPQTVANQQYLGEAERDLPNLPEVEWGVRSLPPGVNLLHVHTFTELYRDHCSVIQEAVHSLQFSAVESIWKKFWQVGGLNNNNNKNKDNKGLPAPIEDDDEGDLSSHIPPAALQSLMRCPPILEWVRAADYQFYQCLVDVLVPDVLRCIPSPLTQAIRNFAKSLEGWLQQALQGCPPQLQQVKLVAVSSLGQMLRRYTSLNHLAQAARAVLHNTDQIKQMLQDLNRVDFHNVHEQASWVCGCDESIISRLEEDFKATLQRPSSLEDWAQWLNQLVDDILKPHQSKQDFPVHARQFLLKWSFYSSMVIRDLTLRSAASFGSFHLIRLLYDEYMFYVVEHKVAKAMNQTPIAVMAQFLSHRKDQSAAPDGGRVLRGGAITNGDQHDGSGLEGGPHNKKMKMEMEPS